MRVTLALHTSNLARNTRSSKSPTYIDASPETCVSSSALRANTSEDESEEGDRTKRVASNKSGGSVEAVVRFGSGKPKLFADSVGFNLSEAVSANSAPALVSSRGRKTVKEVDVALVVAKPTDEGDSIAYRLRFSHSMLDLGHLERDRESIVDRRHDSLR